MHFLAVFFSAFGWQHHIHGHLHLFTTANWFALAVIFRLSLASVKCSENVKGMVRSRVPTARQPPRRQRPPKRSHCLQLPPESGETARGKLSPAPGFSSESVCHASLLGCVFSLFFFLHVSAEFLLGTLPERRVRLLRPPLEMLFWRSFRYSVLCLCSLLWLESSFA